MLLLQLLPTGFEILSVVTPETTTYSMCTGFQMHQLRIALQGRTDGFNSLIRTPTLQPPSAGRCPLVVVLRVTQCLAITPPPPRTKQEHLDLARARAMIDC